jgi:hypothetical protein
MEFEDFDDETPEEAAALDAAAEAGARLQEGTALVPSAEQLSAKLSDLSDGLISAAYDQANGLLIGNFGDWADGETMDKFDAVAAEFNLKAVHEDELGDVVAAYPGSVEVDLEAPLTHTQESMKRWSGYP